MLGLALVGGWTNTSFVNALMMGDMVRVMFLFYLSPVWSVLGGRLFLKERIPPTRWVAVVAAIVGLWMVMGGPGAAGLSLGLVDLLALSAGFAFAANNILARAAQAVPMRTKTLAVFAGCGALSLVATSALGHSVPTRSAPVGFGLLAYGFGWLLLATATWQFGVTHLESSRAGVILLAELVVAVLTALWFGGESLTPMGWAGGALIATAALVEALGSAPDATQPPRRPRSPPRHMNKEPPMIPRTDTPTVWMNQLSWVDYQQRIQRDQPPVLLPVGALEQHGPAPAAGHRRPAVQRRGRRHRRARGWPGRAHPELRLQVATQVRRRTTLLRHHQRGRSHADRPGARRGARVSAPRPDEARHRQRPL